jgi:hypothetical protein
MAVSAAASALPGAVPSPDVSAAARVISVARLRREPPNSGPSLLLQLNSPQRLLEAVDLLQAVKKLPDSKIKDGLDIGLELTPSQSWTGSSPRLRAGNSPPRRRTPGSAPTREYQGNRSVAARPVAKSTGSEMCSCIINHR